MCGIANLTGRVGKSMVWEKRLASVAYLPWMNQWNGTRPMVAVRLELGDRKDNGMAREPQWKSGARQTSLGAGIEIKVTTTNWCISSERN